MPWCSSQLLPVGAVNMLCFLFICSSSSTVTRWRFSCCVLVHAGKEAASWFSIRSDNSSSMVVSQNHEHSLPRRRESNERKDPASTQVASRSALQQVRVLGRTYIRMFLSQRSEVLTFSSNVFAEVTRVRERKRRHRPRPKNTAPAVTLHTRRVDCVYSDTCEKWDV